MCVHIGAHYTFVPISHLSSPLVEVERIWESIIVKWYFFLGGQGALRFAKVFTSKVDIGPSMTLPLLREDIRRQRVTLIRGRTPRSR